MSDPEESLDQRFQDLFSRLSEFRERGLHRSSQRLAREVRQLAKSEGRIIEYLNGSFHLMNNAQSLLEPHFGIEVAIDSIALLESSEKARLIQPDLPEDRYQYTVGWMSACSYDNLAKHIAERDGYNSDGVHDCITDGIQVCRRTGKLDCVNCFREYATDVYKASDDLEMALHHARAVEQSVPRDQTNNDRRWVGAKDQIGIHLLQGQLDAAFDACQRTIALHTTYHTLFVAQLDSSQNLEAVLWLSGRQDEYLAMIEQAGINPQLGRDIPSGESPGHEVSAAKHAALIACCKGEFDSALELLTKFDQFLNSRRCLSSWFDLRLQLVATCLLAGQRPRAERLAAQLEEKAKAARDWLTQRRLKGLMEGTVEPAPLPPVESFKIGPFSRRTTGSGFDSSELAVVGTIASVVATPSDEPAATESSAPTLPVSDISPAFAERLDDWFTRFAVSQANPITAAEVATEIMAGSLSDIRNAEEAGRLIHTLHIISPVGRLAIEAWQWSQRLLETYPNDATLVNVVASLGMTARAFAKNSEPPLEPDEVASADRLDELFRRSLDLNPDRPNNFARAGQFYLTVNRIGDAERCFARGFRLDRKNSLMAQRLADIYGSSDRQQDGLNVLDLCIREGCMEPQLFWQAAMTAQSLSRYQVLVSYLKTYEQVEPNQKWVHYYLAIGYLETGRPAEALQSLDIEAERSPEYPFCVTALRASAAALAGNELALRRHLADVLGEPLVRVDYLTQLGIARLFDRLYAAVLKLPTDSTLRRAVELRGVQAGMAPDSYFSAMRQQGEILEGVNLYVCTFEQPLDDQWRNSPACLYGEENWSSYESHWGVIARDEEEAERFAFAFQSQCFPQSPVLLSVELEGVDYRDRIGVVWQGIHEPRLADDEDDEYDDDDGDDFDLDGSDLDDDDDDEIDDWDEDWEAEK